MAGSRLQTKAFSAPVANRRRAENRFFGPRSGCSESQNAKAWIHWRKRSFSLTTKFLTTGQIPTAVAEDQPAATNFLAYPAMPWCATKRRCRPKAHLPGQPQTVEKHLVQTQLVFLKGLCGFDPRTELLQQSPGHAAGQAPGPTGGSDPAACAHFAPARLPSLPTARPGGHENARCAPASACPNPVSPGAV